MKKRLYIVPVLIMLAAARPAAQAQIPVGSRVGSAAPSGYDDLGRRDPFVSLVTPKKIPGQMSSGRPAIGLAALSVADVLVTGIMKVGADPIALLQGPDGKSFPTKCGDRVKDGVIKRIEADAVIFVQQVEDVLGVLHPKETRKGIRSEGAGR